jgi:RNA polymerase sigma-70 factor (ECF subfamily)
MRFDTTMWRRIDEAKAGSREALETILRTYRGPLLDYLRSRGISEHDAEDIVQQVSIEICHEEFLKKADRSKGRFRTLLLRVTQYVLTSDLRKQLSQKRGGGRSSVSLEKVQEIAVSPQEEEAFNRHWARRMLEAALGRLKERSSGLKVPYHEVLALKFLEEKSIQEIAERLRCKPHDVENYIYQGKERLRGVLHELTQEMCSSEDEHEEETRLFVRYGL